MSDYSEEEKPYVKTIMKEGIIMAFINKILSEEERNNFRERGITNPGNIIRKLDPPYWTVDEENKIILFWCYQDREPPHDETFYFEWKGIQTSFVMRRTNLGPNTFKRTIIKSKLGEDGEKHKDEIINDLRKAMIIYASTGNPNYDLNQKVTLVIDF